jgi:L-iditol 2-dehydrogenase
VTTSTDTSTSTDIDTGTGTTDRSELAGGEIPDTMTAAVMYAPGDIRVEDAAVQRPGPGEVLLKVAACGVCGSDIPRMLRNGGYVMPIICGHEFSGHVAELGDGVTGFDLGDLVSVPPLIPCRHCDFCVRGDFGLCEDYDYFGSRSNGAYAQYVVSPVGNLLKMPAGIDPRAAAMLDPAAIALHALWKTGLRTGQRVLVVGAGPIGLFGVQWAKLAGAGEIVTIDLSAEKSAMAIEAGATHAVKTHDEAKALAGRGFDVVLESAGVPVTVDMAAGLVGPKGHAVFIGIPHAEVTLSKETFNTFLRQEVTLHGSWNSFSAPFPGDEWRTAADKLASGELKWEFMITHQLPLSELPDMMQVLGARSEHSSKVIFMPNGD